MTYHAIHSGGRETGKYALFPKVRVKDIILYRNKLVAVIIQEVLSFSMDLIYFDF